MNPVSRRFALISKAFITVFITVLYAASARAEQQCGQEELSQCAKPLQVLSSTAELSFVTKKSELDQLCPDLHAGLRCIHSYTRRCMSQKQRAHFNQLYHGTNSVIQELCEDGPYQEEFLRHAPCMHSVQRDYERCARRYQDTMSQLGKPRNHTSSPRHNNSGATYEHPRQQHRERLEQMPTEGATDIAARNGGQMSEKIMEQTEGYQQMMRRQHELRQRQLEEQRRRQMALEGNLSPQDEEENEEQLRTVCCSFQEYIRCSQHAVRCQCGEAAAEFTKAFLDKMSSSLIRLHCANYGEDSGRCVGFSAASSSLLRLQLISTVASISTLLLALVFLR